MRRHGCDRKKRNGRSEILHAGLSLLHNATGDLLDGAECGSGDDGYLAADE
jgi:hypothetical protein